MDDATKQAILEELARRQQKGSTNSAATQNLGQQQGPSAGQGYSYRDMLRAATLAKQEEGKNKIDTADEALETARSGLRGMTMGVSDPAGAALAATMAAVKDGDNWGDAYKDIRGTLRYQQGEFEEENPDVAMGAELAGGGAMLGAALGPSVVRAAGPLSRATSAALSRGAARVGGTAKRGAQAVRGAGKAKPKFKVTSDGPVPMNKAAEKALKKANKVTRRTGAAEGASAGAAIDAVEGLHDGDVMPGDKAAYGAVLGAVLPNSVARILVNTPIGRLASSRVAGKVLGQKTQPWVYTGMHPATRRAVLDLLKKGS